jgi:multidrug efflux system membrane fusion protein
MSRHDKFLKTLMATALVTLVGAGCSTNRAANQPQEQIPVTVATVSQRSMPLEVTSVGNVEAISTVSIRPQVSGQLLEVHFKEGDFVRKGQLLLTLDSRPYQAEVEKAKGAIVKDQAQLAQAEANLAKDGAQEAYARGEAERYSLLWDKGLVAREIFDQMKAQSNAASESLRADKAAVDSAKASLVLDQSNLNAANVQLSYCSIYSPMDGRTGAVLLKAGNLLKAADAPVVVINQVDPIDVNFTVPQQYWSDIKKENAAHPLKVTATAQDSASKGNLSFVDSAVDPATGTLHLKATFENSDHTLWPGLFVNVVLRLAEQPNAIVVPAQAINQGQNGPFVYIVKGNVVDVRPIVSTRQSGGFAVIDQGLSPAEIVVVDGQSRLTRGSKVQIKSGQATPTVQNSSTAPPTGN